MCKAKRWVFFTFNTIKLSKYSHYLMINYQKPKGYPYFSNAPNCPLRKLLYFCKECAKGIKPWVNLFWNCPSTFAPAVSLCRLWRWSAKYLFCSPVDSFHFPLYAAFRLAFSFSYFLSRRCFSYSDIPRERSCQFPTGSVCLWWEPGRKSRGGCWLAGRRWQKYGPGGKLKAQREQRWYKYEEVPAMKGRLWRMASELSTTLPRRRQVEVLETLPAKLYLAS